MKPWALPEPSSGASPLPKPGALGAGSDSAGAKAVPHTWLEDAGPSGPTTAWSVPSSTLTVIRFPVPRWIVNQVPSGDLTSVHASRFPRPPSEPTMVAEASDSLILTSVFPEIAKNEPESGSNSSESDGKPVSPTSVIAPVTVSILESSPLPSITKSVTPSFPKAIPRAATRRLVWTTCIALPVIVSTATTKSARSDASLSRPKFVPAAKVAPSAPGTGPRAVANAEAVD